MIAPENKQSDGEAPLMEPRRRDCQDLDTFLFQTGGANEFLKEMDELREANKKADAAKQRNAGQTVKEMQFSVQTAINK